MPSSADETAAAMAPQAEGLACKPGKIWRFLAVGGGVLGLLALFAWGLTRDPKLIPTPSSARRHPD